MIPPTAEPCPVVVDRLEWVRIQLVVTLRTTPGSNDHLLAGDLALRSPDSRRPPLVAAEAVQQAPAQGRRRFRFNVFAAADRKPLEPGRWELVMRRGDEECFVGAGEHLNLESAARDFSYTGGMYRIEVRADAKSDRVAVLVSVWNSVGGRRSPLRRLVSWARVSRRRAWIRLFQAVVACLGALPRTGRLIVFTSDSRVELGGNLKLIHDRMLARGLGRRYRLRSIFKPSVRARRGPLDRIRFVWLLSRADVILLDDYQPAIYRLPPRQGVRIIQLWHAWGAFKTVGYSRIGKPGGPSPYSPVHRNYTYATVSSAWEVPFYAEAFGIPESAVVPTGTPRMDEFLDPRRQEHGRQRALAAIPSVQGRQVILFAPTFRGSGARTARYPTEVLDLQALYRLCVERDAVVVFKMHPFIRRALDIPTELNDRLIDASHSGTDVNDLLLISDLLITDYSSLVFEFSTLDRPMLFFAFDLEEYVASRDFYEPFADFVPGRIVRSFPELLDAIRSDEYERHKIAPFAKRHLPEGKGSATDRIIDQLILGK